MKKYITAIVAAFAFSLSAGSAMANTLTQGYVFNHQTQQWQWQNVMISGTYITQPQSEIVYQSPVYESPRRYVTTPANTRTIYAPREYYYTIPANNRSRAIPAYNYTQSGEYIWQNDAYGGRWIYCPK